MNIAGPSKGESQRTSGELCKYVQGSNFISPSVPRFVQGVTAHCQLLEKAYAKAGGSRTKESIAKILLSDLRRSIKHTYAFNDLETELQE